MASQIVPAMVAIGNGKTFVLSEKYIVTNISVENPLEKWSDVQLALGLSSLLEAPVFFKDDEYHKFGKKLEVHFNCLFPGDILYVIIKSVNFDIKLIDQYHIYIFKQLIWKTFEFRGRKVNQVIQYIVCLFLLKNKSVLELALKRIPKLKRKAEMAVPFHLFKRSGNTKALLLG
jgi:hypothetical protein